MLTRELSSSILWTVVFSIGSSLNAESSPQVASAPAVSSVDAAYLVDLAERAAVASASSPNVLWCARWLPASPEVLKLPATA